MNTIRRSTFAFFAALALLFTGAAQAQTRPAALVEGRDYVAIAEGIPYTKAPGKTEIAEVFGYWCHHCNNFQPLVDKWKPGLPKTVNFVYVPAAFDPQDPYARAYFAARQLRLPADKVHHDLFRAIHTERSLPMNASENELAQFHTRYGVSAEKFLAAMNSKPVATQMAWARQFAETSQVEGTPTLIVAGKYRILGNSHQDALRIAAQLAAQLQSQRR